MARFRFNNTPPSSERGPRFLIVGRKRLVPTTCGNVHAIGYGKKKDRTPSLYLREKNNHFWEVAPGKNEQKNKARVIKDSCRTNYCYNSPAHLKI